MSSDGLTRDAFLGGRLTILQPKIGYRAGIDAVLLAASVSAAPGQSVLELGCGVGVASLCLMARMPGLSVTGVERQADQAELARRNSTENALDLSVVMADLSALPAPVRAARFDHVFANPPYFDRQRGPAAPSAVREAAVGEDTPLTTWVEVATRRLRDGGSMTMILPAERLPDLLQAMSPRLGSAIVKPLAPRPGRAAQLFLFRARKGGRSAFRLLEPLNLHVGATHTDGPKDYDPAIAAVLRSGVALRAFDA